MDMRKGSTVRTNRRRLIGRVLAVSAVVVAVGMIWLEMAVDQAPVYDERSYIEGFDVSPELGIPPGGGREPTEAQCDEALGKQVDPGIDRHDWIEGCADAVLGAPQQRVWGFTGTSLTLEKESADGSVRWTADLIDSMGGLGAGSAVALENPFTPRSEVTLPMTGFALGQGGLDPGSVLLWTTLGSLVRAGILYWIGMLFGRDRLHAVWSKLPLVRPRHLKRMEGWFARNRGKAVLLGHIVPVGRTVISLPAGIERMPPRMFLILATLGSLIWNSALILAGYHLVENWGLAEGYVGILAKTFLIVVGITVAMHMIGKGIIGAMYVVRRLSNRIRTQRRGR
jgi:membrane protein DedA with SNARE-associated domain